MDKKLNKNRVIFYTFIFFFVGISYSQEWKGLECNYPYNNHKRDNDFLDSLQTFCFESIKAEILDSGYYMIKIELNQRIIVDKQLYCINSKGGIAKDNENNYWQLDQEKLRLNIGQFYFIEPSSISSGTVFYGLVKNYKVQSVVIGLGTRTIECYSNEIISILNRCNQME